MKLLHIVTGLKPGGAERVVLDLCSNNKEHENIVLSLSTNTEMLDLFESKGIQVIVGGIDKNLKGIFKIFTLLRFVIKSLEFDCIHAHMTHSLAISMIIKLVRPRVKVVFTSHSFNIGGGIRPYFIFLTRPFRAADILFSGRQNKWYYKNRPVIIPNGINTVLYENPRKAIGIPTKPLRFVVIGRLEKVKNQLALIDILSKVKKNGGAFQLNIVGKGPLQGVIEERISDLGLDKEVNLLGFRRDIPEILKNSDCLLIPSLWEGLPIVLLEAGAAGIPVISTPVGSIDSLIREGINGRVVPLKEFENVLLDMIFNYPNYQKMGQKLQETIKQEYDIHIIVEKHNLVYQK